MPHFTLALRNAMQLQNTPTKMLSFLNRIEFTKVTLCYSHYWKCQDRTFDANLHAHLYDLIAAIVLTLLPPHAAPLKRNIIKCLLSKPTNYLLFIQAQCLGTLDAYWPRRCIASICFIQRQPGWPRYYSNGIKDDTYTLHGDTLAISRLLPKMLRVDTFAVNSLYLDVYYSTSLRWCGILDYYH